MTIITPVFLVKRKLMKKTAGAFKGTKLATDAFWKDVFRRKSGKKAL